MNRTFIHQGDNLLQLDFNVQGSIDKARCRQPLCNNRNPKPFEVDVPFRKIRRQLNKHVLIVENIAGFTVDLAIRTQNCDVESVNVGRTRGARVFSARLWLVLPFLEQLVSFYLSRETYLGNLLGLPPWASAWCIRSKVSNHRSGCDSRRRDVGRGGHPYLKVLGGILVGRLQDTVDAVLKGVYIYK